MEFRKKKTAILREAILDETIKILETEGPDMITIRKIAQSLGCSVGVVYNYFSDKNEILKEIYLKTCRQFLHALINLPAASKDKRQNFEDLCCFICEFRIKNSAKYREIFRLQVFDKTPEPLLAIREFLAAKLDALKLAALDSKEKLDAARLIITALTEGMASSENINCKKQLKIMKKGIHTLLKGWSQGE